MSSSSDNGILGGDKFAAELYPNTGANQDYYAFDGRIDMSSLTATSSYTSSAYWVIYNPIPIKIKTIQMYDTVTNHSYRPVTGDIYGSNDNNIYTKLGSWNFPDSTGNLQPLPLITLNNDNFYKYYKLQATSATWFHTPEIELTATYLTNVLNSITFPTTFTNTNYGFAMSYFGGKQPNVYLSQKTISSVRIEEVQGNASSANYIAIGY